MTANISVLYDDVMSEVPGCPKALALNALRRAARDFCTYSKVDRRNLASFNTVSGTAAYTLTAPTGTEIVEVLRLKYDDEYLSPILFDQIPADDDAGPAENYAVDQSAVVTFSPIPNEVVAIIANVAVMPTMAATTISDELMKNWGDTIAKGAKARLMAMIKKAWSDPAAAAKYRNEFENDKSSARDSAVRGQSRAPFRTVPSTIMGR